MLQYNVTIEGVARGRGVGFSVSSVRFDRKRAKVAQAGLIHPGFEMPGWF